MTFANLVRFCFDRIKKGDSLKDVSIKLSIFFNIEKQERLAKFYLKKFS